MNLSLSKFSEYQKLFVKETSAQILEKLIRIFVGLYVIREISSYFDVELFGVFNFIESYFLIFVALSFFGTDSILVRLLQGSKKYQKIIGNGIVVLTVTSILFILFSIIISQFLVSKQSLSYTFIVSIGLLFSPLIVFEAFYISLNKIRVTSYFKIFTFLIKSALILFFINRKFDFNFFIYLIILEHALSGFLIFLFFKFQKFKISFEFDIKLLKEILVPSFYVFIYSIGALIFLRIDLFMIENYLNDFEMGIYTASFKILSFFYFIPNIIAQTLYPRIIQIFKSNQKEFEPLKKMYKLSFISGFFVFILLLLLGDYMIDFLYGSEFNDSKYILKILSFNILFVSISSVYYKVLYSSMLEKRLFFRVFLAIILNIILNMVLIPIYKLEGVALATIISLFFLEFIYDFFDKKLIDLHIFKLKSILKL
tara:strand:+ start:1898 stop:3175 length:1278 start_codon:yes stop_codon:yes gene_type:complete